MASMMQNPTGHQQDILVLLAYCIWDILKRFLAH